MSGSHGVGSAGLAGALGLALAVAVAVTGAVAGCGDEPTPARSDAATIDAVSAGDAAVDADPDGPAAFRIAVLELRDPHAYFNMQGCKDITDTTVMQFSINGRIKARVETDGDGDGALDQSLVMVFRPLAQHAATGAVELHRARCTAPLATTTCQPDPAAPPLATTANNLVDVTCVSPVGGTLRPYAPAVTSAFSPCYRLNAATLTLDVAGVAVPLRDARIGATYFGDPAQSNNNGLLLGFVSVTDARATIVPAAVPLIGGRTLESLLPGGNGACPGFSDQDMDGADRGWWLYFNFTAPRVGWTDR